MDRSTVEISLILNLHRDVCLLVRFSIALSWFYIAARSRRWWCCSYRENEINLVPVHTFDNVASDEVVMLRTRVRTTCNISRIEEGAQSPYQMSSFWLFGVDWNSWFGNRLRIETIHQEETKGDVKPNMLSKRRLKKDIWLIQCELLNVLCSRITCPGDFLLSKHPIVWIQILSIKPLVLLDKHSYLHTLESLPHIHMIIAEEITVHLIVPFLVPLNSAPLSLRFGSNVQKTHYSAIPILPSSSAAGLVAPLSMIQSSTKRHVLYSYRNSSFSWTSVSCGFDSWWLTVPVVSTWYLWPLQNSRWLQRQILSKHCLVLMFDSMAYHRVIQLYSALVEFYNFEMEPLLCGLDHPTWYIPYRPHHLTTFQIWLISPISSLIVRVDATSLFET